MLSKHIQSFTVNDIRVGLLKTTNVGLYYTNLSHSVIRISLFVVSNLRLRPLYHPAISSSFPPVIHPLVPFYSYAVSV